MIAMCPCSVTFSVSSLAVLSANLKTSVSSLGSYMAIPGVTWMTYGAAKQLRCRRMPHGRPGIGRDAASPDFLPFEVFIRNVNGGYSQTRNYLIIRGYAVGGRPLCPSHNTLDLDFCSRCIISTTTSTSPSRSVQTLFS
ncbi:hypothetical protein B0H67DRAFT_36373 [Lasiosphaeris hirsuta]|uniref:Secreted protein n=1 Tax=Lasiosphaeris hirsuta TaxID=260670 RepID=A0AA40BA82_9PEZI|nr:hypothetical protein B0H67DRAFT_36373 [Lasiosphaeris hirsuta]